MKHISIISRSLPTATIFALIALLAVWPSSEGQLRSPLYLNELETMVVRTTEGFSAQFKVVTVTTDADQAQGLMYIRHLPIDRGMLFSYSRSQVLSMWMKNTHVPLDMWFIDDQGRIQKVVTHTVPHSLDSIKSDTPVRAVIEVNAGLSTLLGVTKGAVIEHRVFQRQ
ncbi:MAG: DUF192 domain-containing protein [Gammaproteobacteria bacterium]|nr:DUF192 domain-containing protein [Gammaproteobacteria bacterium]MYC25298.1 DUF192 domain-containing protein [Gammaproteobacteria bacterium]